jgi:hypothetical protein
VVHEAAFVTDVIVEAANLHFAYHPVNTWT